MTFSAPRVPPVLETQKVMVNEVEETPVACVDTSYTDGVAPPIINEPPGGDNGPVVVTIGTVTVTGDATPVVGDTETFTASHDGTATDVVFTFSAPGETFTGGTVTWANTGAATVTVTATSVTATDSPVTGTLAVTVGAALSIALSSPDFAEGAQMPACAGNSVTNPCGGGPISPALNWPASGTPNNGANINSYRLRCTDNDAGGYIHWSVDGISDAIVNIPQETNPNNLTFNASATINQTGGGPGAAFPGNGFEGFDPGNGVTHTYSFVVTAHSADGTLLATSNTLTGTYTG
jgi:phosphatidylethanolamine-binding protein (PEBP) family uncharacterized protein